MLAIGVAAAALRLPFLFAGLSMDEGGYATVAREWANGARLYSPTAWVDRPQGLLVLYRALLLISDSAWAIRLGVVIAGALVAMALVVSGRLLASAPAGIVAGSVYAVAAIAPAAEGFTFNGELAASVFTTLALTLALVAVRPARHPTLVFLCAGLAAGCAVTVKQSAFDGLVVAGVVLLARRDRLRWGRAGATLLCGFTAVLAASVAHGVSVGFSHYWWSIIGYRMDAPSGGAAPLEGRLDLLDATIHTVAWDVAPLVVVAGLGLVVAWRRTGGPTSLIVGCWLAASFLGFNAGGLYWPHYFVQLLAPLCLGASLLIAVVPRRLAVAVGVALCAPVAVTAAAWSMVPDSVARQEIPYLRRSDVDAQVARELAHCPAGSLIALPSEADLYFLANRPPPFPYLWGRGLTEIPHAEGQLMHLLGARKAPALVADYANGWSSLDPTGVDRRRLRSYVDVRDFPGVRLLARNRSIASACRLRRGPRRPVLTPPFLRRGVPERRPPAARTMSRLPPPRPNVSVDRPRTPARR